jgi:hypothetical protein
VKSGGELSRQREHQCKHAETRLARECWIVKISEGAPEGTPPLINLGLRES